YTREAQKTSVEGNPLAAKQVTPLTRADLPTLVSFDARHFGAARDAVLAMCLQRYGERMFATRDETGALTGYLVAQEQRIGPWVAATPAGAEALLAHTLTLAFAAPAAVLAPALNRDAIELLERYGFTSSRELRHMRHGGAPALERRRRVYGLASFAIG